MNNLYYLCFSVNKLPDLTLTKYSVFDGSSVDNIMDKHGVFLRQLHRLGYTSGVYFHLLYHYNPDIRIPKGHHLTIVFYATAKDRKKLDGIREFLISSVLSPYYDFFCYEVSKDFSIEEETLIDGSTLPILKLTNISGAVRKYSIGKTNVEEIHEAQESIRSGKYNHIVCEIASDADVVLSFNRMPIDDQGRIISEKRYRYGAFLTKKDYNLPAQNRLNIDSAGDVPLFSIMEWEPCDTGRLFNVLKLMEGYDRSAVLRIDIFPVEHTQVIRQRLPFAETRRRISDRTQGKDDNSENIVRSWDKYLSNLMKFPQFLANIVSFADSQDVAVMLTDSVAAEAVESGTYLVETIQSQEGFTMYESDSAILHTEKEPGNYFAPFLSLFTLEEMRPMFSFPILYPGEAIECQKETDPIPFSKEVTVDSETGELHEVISLGVSSMGYDVTFPIKLFKKHAFIAGVPGAGKTNTMLYLVTTLWRDTKQKIPFLVLEPAKQEYRALAMISGMEDLCVFSPGADTHFPLHINPFQFPVGLTLAEHIANLNAVFAGAFELIPPSPYLIDSCIEKIYLDKGWNINERNDGSKVYPTMQELYDSLKIAVEESGYEGESKANIRSVMEVRIGSLLRREIGHVYNVIESSLEPSEWLSCPVIIELEALGEGPANFMSLLISTLIREALKIKKTSDFPTEIHKNGRHEIEHIIFYEEAHNLIGPTTDDPIGGSVDPKVSATKYLVKMLAEVRALGEGIVIADQLPTAMAPEVLKNTGLKIGHRITAQDDRNLLGSTMSASADQLEEQGTFGIGQALVFYENLLKPFKMSVCEWEKGTSSQKYNSPTNLQLFEHLKNNERYNELLGRSSRIMQQKMEVEFDALREKAKSLKDTIERKYSDLQINAGNLKLLENKLKSLADHQEISETKKQIANLRHTYEKNAAGVEKTLSREATKVSWDYSNLYYAYMTLSKNYSYFSDDMYICTINNYFSLFSILRSLHDAPTINSIVLRESERVIADISKYVDISFSGENALLFAHPGYANAIYESGNYYINFIDNKTLEYVSIANSLLCRGGDQEESYTELGRSISKQYFSLLTIAERFYSVVDGLAQQLKSDLIDVISKKTIEWDLANRRAIEYESRKNILYRGIVSFVSKIFKQVSGIDGINRRAFLIQTNDMLYSFRTLVDYRNKYAKTILSDWSRYEEIWKGTNEILCMEMSAKFAYLYQMRTDILGQNSTKTVEQPSDSQIYNICLQYNTVFQMYVPIDEGSFEFNCIIVNHYVRYLDAVLRLGARTHTTIAKTSNGNWKICSEIIKKLLPDTRISAEKRSDWNRLSIIMKSICDAG